MTSGSQQVLFAVVCAVGTSMLVSVAAAQPIGPYQGMDRNRDGVVTRAEWRGNDQSFRRHDRNNDGMLSADEVRAASEYDGIGLVGDFGVVDLDGNGHVTVQEWRRAFTQLDDNRDGSLTPDELRLSNNRSPAVTQAFRAGHDRGLVDGRQAGREDRAHRWWDLDGQRELENADAGYRNELGARDQYQSGYREGFRQGYSEGFGPRR